MRAIILLLALIFYGCTSNPILGYWASKPENENSAVVGIPFKRNKKCIVYVAPPNHSVFAGNCIYEVNGNTYQVYTLNADGDIDKDNVLYIAMIQFLIYLLILYSVKNLITMKSYMKSSTNKARYYSPRKTLGFLVPEPESNNWQIRRLQKNQNDYCRAF